MARLIGGIFGMVSGKVGDVVYRRRGGKTVVCALPSKRTTPKSKLELELQTKFSYTGKIARTINSIEILKHFWKPNASEHGSSCNKIFKNNYRLIDAKDLSGPILITPREGFNLNNPSIIIGKTSLAIKCNSLKGCIRSDRKVKIYISAAGIVVLKNPTSEQIPLYNIIGFKSKKQLLNTKENLSINYEFGTGELALLRDYSIKKIYAVFVIMDEDDSPVRHSITFSN